jgi:hypothetical protein
MYYSVIDGTVTVPVSWLSISSLLVLFTIGVAWGSLSMRVKNIEVSQREKVSKDEFKTFIKNLKDIQEDIRELRRTMQTVIARDNQ